jgi:hypothetical protein
MENDAEIFPAHCTWKVAEKGFNMASMMNKLGMINSCEIILKNIFFAKNHPEIQVSTILVCALYSIKYNKYFILYLHQETQETF